jgi:hypothetical protein
VERSLNEGQAEENAELIKQSNLEDNLRRVALQNLVTQIQTDLGGTSVGTNGTKDPKRVQAEEKVCVLVHNFQSRWGADSTGVIGAVLVQNQVDCDSSPPKIQPGATPSVDLIPGVPSKKFLLPVSDIMGAWSLKLTNSSSDSSVLPATNVQIIMPAQGSDGAVQFTATALPNSAPTADISTIITFLVTNVGGSWTNLAVVAKVHKPTLTFPGIGATPNSTTFALNDPNTIGFFDALFPIYDSEPGNLTNWSFSLQPGSAGWQMWNVTNSVPATLESIGGIQNIKSTLSIDGSLATNSSLNFTLFVKYGTNTIATNNIVTSRGGL